MLNNKTDLPFAIDPIGVHGNHPFEQFFWRRLANLIPAELNFKLNLLSYWGFRQRFYWMFMTTVFMGRMPI